MLIIFPKYSYYEDKPTERKLKIDKIINSVLSEFEVVNPTILIEDEFACCYLKNKRPVSCTNKRDISTIKTSNMYGDYTANILSMFPAVENISVELEEFKTVPLSVIKTKGKEYFYEKSAELCKARSKSSVEYSVRRERVVIIFTSNKLSKNYLAPEPKENDGLLYIKTNLETGNTECYYSGLWIDKENARKVIGALYGG